MTSIDSLTTREIRTRQKARQDHREDRLDNPYDKGTFERIIYHAESQQITFEGILATERDITEALR